jgi:pyridoxamine 5'-phosphate oxidase
MPDPFVPPNELDAIRADIWARWTRGGADRRSAFHTPVVASVGADGAPEQRVMVLRKVDPATATFRFHTDVRSGKVVQLNLSARVSVVGYDPGAKIQLRASGVATIVQTGALADEAWASTSASGRRSYLTTLAPGSISDGATSGLPTAFETEVPSLTESEAGRANFAIVQVIVNRLEWLHLAATGHRRAAFTLGTLGNDGWTGEWLIP